MATATSFKTDQQVTSGKLKVVENVARYKNRSLRMERTMNVSLIVVEYLFYLFAFIALFKWRVLPNFELTNVASWKHPLVNDYLFLYSVFMVIYTIMMVNRKLFVFYRTTSFTDDWFSIIKAGLLSFLIATGILFLLKTGMIYSRLVIVLYSISIIVIATFIRLLKLGLIFYLKKTDRLTKNILIVGAGKIGEDIGRLINSSKTSGYRVVGYLDDYKSNDQIIGKVKELEQVIQENQIDEIYITIPSERTLINKTLGTIRKYNVDIKIVPELYDFVTTSVQFKRTDAYPYMEVVKTPLKGINLFFKRTVDIILSLLGIIVSSPILLITALFIKLDSKGPIIFKQQRIGKNGMPFNMYKFRSMVSNAEALKAQLIGENEADGPVFKIKSDPRITRVGHFIRRYSIDELPQFFNVLKGDMSLIGPRPPLPNEVEQYNDEHWRRLDIRPGISGLWQVSGRSDLSFEEWVNLDIYYIENWSIMLDTKILLRTIPVVLFGKGAY